MRKQAVIILCAAAIGPVWGSGVRAQEIVDEALQSFPTQIERLEYSNPAELRGLPNYPALRQRYLGATLQDIERSLATLGIQESDVDELVLGWQTTSAKNAGSGGLWGLAGGHFMGEEIARAAAALGLKPVPVGDLEAYCVDSAKGGTCVALFDSGRGAFGSLKQLSFMVAAREGIYSGLSSNKVFDNLVNQARPHASIWGVAKGSAIAGWLRASAPNQDGTQINWSQLLSGVKALTYSIDLGDKVHLEMKLACRSNAAAGDLRVVLDGLRLLQKMAWRNKNPTLPNPFEHVELDSSGDEVKLGLDTPIPTS